MGPATDKHKAPTHQLKLYVRAVIESEAWPTAGQKSLLIKAKKSLLIKAVFKLKSFFGELSPNVNTSLHIFDHTIKPILLYGCEIGWGATIPSKAPIRNEPYLK